MARRWLTDHQVCQKLGNCSRTTLWRLRKQAVVPMPKLLGGRNLTEEQPLERCIDAALMSIEDAADEDEAA